MRLGLRGAEVAGRARAARRLVALRRSLRRAAAPGVGHIASAPVRVRARPRASSLPRGLGAKPRGVRTLALLRCLHRRATAPGIGQIASAPVRVRARAAADARLEPRARREVLRRPEPR